MSEMRTLSRSLAVTKGSWSDRDEMWSWTLRTTHGRFVCCLFVCSDASRPAMQEQMQPVRWQILLRSRHVHVKRVSPLLCSSADVMQTDPGALVDQDSEDTQFQVRPVCLLTKSMKWNRPLSGQRSRGQYDKDEKKPIRCRSDGDVLSPTGGVWGGCSHEIGSTRTEDTLASAYLRCASGCSSSPAPAERRLPEGVALLLLLLLFSPPSLRLCCSSCSEALTHPTAKSSEGGAGCRGSAASLSSCCLGFLHWLLPVVSPQPPRAPPPPPPPQHALSCSPPAVCVQQRRCGEEGRGCPPPPCCLALCSGSWRNT